jgi:iron complex transport system substrate-binding protein
MTYGYIIDREDEAEEFCDWFEGYFDLIESRTEGLSDDERPRVYFEYRRYRTKGLGDRYSHWYIMAGGRNIADDKVGLDSPQYSSVFDVDREYVVLQNPDFIFMHASTQLPATEHGYETDYVIDEALLGVAGTLMGAAYAAKVMHPQLFTDLDPEAIHQECDPRKAFQGLLSRWYCLSNGLTGNT